MKKRRMYVIFLLIIFMFGCTSQEKNEMPIVKNTEGNTDKSLDLDVNTEVPAKEDLFKEIGLDNVVEVLQDHVIEDEKPLYELNEANWSVTPVNEQTEGKLVLLTIDDAPDKYALEMAKTLKNNHANAIFFVNGHFIQTDEKKQILKEIHNLGFPIGNHTMTHRNLRELTIEEQYHEIVELNKQIEKIIGEKPKFFRAPFGSNTDYSKELVKEEGMLLMNWTYGYDWEKGYMEKEALTNIMVNSPLLIHGANLLMHDREWTNSALNQIIKGLREKGYKIVDPDRIKI